MQVKNNYKQEWKILDPSGRFAKEEGVGVFNGDIGFVKAVDDYEQRIVVEFDDGRRTEYPYNQLEELEHAFAITIHKSQGSEYPVVVIPLLRCPPKLLNRNLLYTAVTRARRSVVIVGNIGLVNTMIDNEDEQKRYTHCTETQGDGEKMKRCADKFGFGRLLTDLLYPAGVRYVTRCFRWEKG